MHILVVDDDSVVRMSMRTVLTAEGYKVTTVADGEQAVLKLSEEKFDLVISDIYMPVVDGISLRKIVREMPATAALPILFISGHDDSQTVSIVRDTAREGFHKKGTSVFEMLAWVKYLTTPIHKRPSLRPNMSTKPITPPQLAGRGRGNARVPIM